MENKKYTVWTATAEIDSKTFNNTNKISSLPECYAPQEFDSFEEFDNEEEAVEYYNDLKSGLTFHDYGRYYLCYGCGIECEELSQLDCSYGGDMARWHVLHLNGIAVESMIVQARTEEEAIEDVANRLDIDEWDIDKYIISIEKLLD